MRKLLSFTILICCFHLSSSQTTTNTEGVSIASTTSPPHSSAMLDVQSITKGILIPTMTIARMQGISNPRHGLMVFVDEPTANDAEDGFYYYDENSSTWVNFGGSGGGGSAGSGYWTASGNQIINTSSDGVTIKGNDQRNELFFEGTLGDNQQWIGIHTAVVDRIYGTGEKSELLLFKGNDKFSPSGPDRIRLDAVGGIVFQVGVTDGGAGGRVYDPGVEGNTAMIIDGNGNVFIGNTNLRSNLVVAGDVTTQGSFFPSDEQLKQNINNLIGSLEYLEKLNPVTFNWKEEGRDSLLNYGLIAQDVEKIFPSIVSSFDSAPSNGTDKESIKSISYIQLIPILVQGIKELKDEVELLKQYDSFHFDQSRINKELDEAKNKIAHQEKELLDLKTRISKIEYLLNREK